MPSGKTHTVATSLSAGTMAIVMSYAQFPTSEVIATFAGFMTTLVVNPDLDLNRRKPREVLPFLWWAFWFPYSRLMKHRSSLSHWPVISTLLRVTYLAIPIFLLTDYIGINNNISNYYYFFAGMVISDILHFLMDWSVTGLKRAVRWK